MHLEIFGKRCEKVNVGKFSHTYFRRSSGRTESKHSSRRAWSMRQNYCMAHEPNSVPAENRVSVVWFEKYKFQTSVEHVAGERPCAWVNQRSSLPLVMFGQTYRSFHVCRSLEQRSHHRCLPHGENQFSALLRAGWNSIRAASGNRTVLCCCWRGGFMLSSLYAAVYVWLGFHACLYLCLWFLVALFV